MIIIFTILLLLMFAYFSYKEKNIYNPISILTGLWSLVFLFSALRLYGMIEYNNRSVVILFIGIVCIILGFLLTKKIFSLKQDKINKKIEKKHDYKYNIVLIRAILIVSVIFLIPFVIYVVDVLKNGVPYNNIRTLYYSYGGISLIKSKQLFTIFDWYVNGIMLIMPAILISMVFNKQKDNFSIVLMIIFIILEVFVTSGRLQILLVFFEIVLMILIKKVNIMKLSKRIKMVVLVGAAAFCIFIGAFSILRNNNKNSITNFYSYPAIVVPYFSKMVEYIDDNNIMTKGYATFYGPYLLVQKSIKLITGKTLSNSKFLHDIINYPQNKWVRIFDKSSDSYNAFSSMFYPFYLDFGVRGVIIFSALYGLLLGSVYFCYQKSKNEKLLIIYLLFSVGLVTSFIKWQFSSPVVWVCLVLVNILVSRKKLKK